MKLCSKCKSYRCVKATNDYYRWECHQKLPPWVQDILSRMPVPRRTYPLTTNFAEFCECFLESWKDEKRG